MHVGMYIAHILFLHYYNLLSQTRDTFLDTERSDECFGFTMMCFFFVFFCFHVPIR